eukprot:3571791-Pleurochrysis_carterae.AAC.1
MRRTIKPINSTTGRVTPLATLPRMLGLRCVMWLVGMRLRSTLAVRAAVNDYSSGAANCARRNFLLL